LEHCLIYKHIKTAHATPQMCTILWFILSIKINLT
jgi:hypothetical protein